MRWNAGSAARAANTRVDPARAGASSCQTRRSWSARSTSARARPQPPRPGALPGHDGPPAHGNRAAEPDHLPPGAGSARASRSCCRRPRPLAGSPRSGRQGATAAAPACHRRSGQLVVTHDDAGGTRHRAGSNVQVQVALAVEVGSAACWPCRSAPCSRWRAAGTGLEVVAPAGAHRLVGVRQRDLRRRTGPGQGAGIAAGTGWW